MIFVGSLLPALLWGVALGNLLKGVPIDASKNFIGGFFDLLSPYTLVTGLTTLLVFVTHGAVFLNLKSDRPHPHPCPRASRRRRARSPPSWSCSSW